MVGEGVGGDRHFGGGEGEGGCQDDGGWWSRRLGRRGEVEVLKMARMVKRVEWDLDWGLRGCGAYGLVDA